MPASVGDFLATFWSANLLHKEQISPEITRLTPLNKPLTPVRGSFLDANPIRDKFVVELRCCMLSNHQSPFIELKIVEKPGQNVPFFFK